MSYKEELVITEDNKDLTGLVIGAALEVHSYCGPGLMESAYQECLIDELVARGIKYEQGVVMPLNYSRETALGLRDLPDAPVDTFDGIRRVDQPSNLWRVFEKRG